MAELFGIIQVYVCQYVCVLLLASNLLDNC